MAAAHAHCDIAVAAAQHCGDGVAIAAEAEGEIRFSWIERDDDDLSRRGTMYCFKSCSVNNN